MKPIFKYRNIGTPEREVGQFSVHGRNYTNILSVKDLLELFPKPDVEKFRPYTSSDKNSRGYVVIKVPIELWQEWEQGR